jgi:putative transposase
MKLPPAALIVEDAAELRALERSRSDKLGSDRVRLLRLLKEGQVAGLAAAARLLGCSQRTAERWWQRYRTGGLTALLAPGRPGGARTRITEPAWAGLLEEMRAGHIGGLHAAQVYLRERWGIGYGIDALSKLFQRRKVKLKTGRPRHRRAPSTAEQAAFKKGAGRDGRPAGAASGLRHGRGALRAEGDPSPPVVPTR